jgi:hypothetical protein
MTRRFMLRDKALRQTGRRGISLTRPAAPEDSSSPCPAMPRNVHERHRSWVLCLTLQGNYAFFLRIDIRFLDLIYDVNFDWNPV